LSPQTRRGRAAPANRKARSRADAGPGPEPVAESSKAEAPAESPVESRPHTEGKRARVAQGRHKRQHGTAYRWFIAYLPIMVVLFALLGALWVYTGFINPPPPTPAQQWAKIEAKWSPARETARAAVAAVDTGGLAGLDLFGAAPGNVAQAGQAFAPDTTLELKLRGVFFNGDSTQSSAIIAEASLSFLGLGVQPPTPSWGTMLNAAQQFLETAPWMSWWPGLAIFTLALSFNLAGDGLRDFLDPKDY